MGHIELRSPEGATEQVVGLHPLFGDTKRLPNRFRRSPLEERVGEVDHPIPVAKVMRKQAAVRGRLQTIQPEILLFLPLQQIVARCQPVQD